MINKKKTLQIVNTTRDDLDAVMLLFNKAIALQGKNGYKVWAAIDQAVLYKDIDGKHQYKIIQDDNILCIFSVQLNDPFIWGSRDQHDAIYLHRIVVNPDFKGQKQFQHVLMWAKEHTKQMGRKYVRMDTWAENHQLIEYYETFGFVLSDIVQTSNAEDLPIQNRNLRVALLELRVHDDDK